MCSLDSPSCQLMLQRVSYRTKTCSCLHLLPRPPLPRKPEAILVPQNSVRTRQHRLSPLLHLHRPCAKTMITSSFKPPSHPYNPTLSPSFGLVQVVDQPYRSHQLLRLGRMGHLTDQRRRFTLIMPFTLWEAVCPIRLMSGGNMRISPMESYRIITNGDWGRRKAGYGGWKARLNS